MIDVMIGRIVFGGALVAFECYQFACIHRGKNWARILLLMGTVGGTARIFFEPSLLGNSDFVRLGGLLNLACSWVCICLLFFPDSAKWFRKRSA